MNDGDIITIDADDSGRANLGNGMQIIIDGVTTPLYLNGTPVTEQGGTAFHTSCSPGTPKVGDTISSGGYSFEVIGGGSTGNENICRVLDLECDAAAAPLLDFQNLTDPDEAPESGDALKFTAPFTNNAANANASATNVEVTVTYDDSQFTYVNGSATGGDSQDANTSGEIVFTINSLAAGATETLMFNLTVNSGATAGRVTASITAATGSDVDSTPDNLGLFAAEDDECEATFTNLPVELVAFEAQADGRSATLAWQTASETNNAGFELQHRYLGEANKAGAFSALAFIEGHGTTEVAQRYQFRLDDLEPGRHVFRLKQLDYDGSFDYSPEIEVAIDLPEAYLVSNVYPNP
ncbi:MAG TPA: hypothetical protein VKP65_17220, partial [Rhodothermales bacterium]|nr:hypothetical protein [Rhodothermales bacterium]